MKFWRPEMNRKRMFYKQDVILVETGEVIQAVAVIPEVKDKNFAKVFKLFSEKVLQDLGIVNGEAKLLLWFIAKTVDQEVQGDMWIILDYEKVAKEIGVSIATLYNYLSKLKKLGYIEQAKPRNSIYRLKPDFMYKGVLNQYYQEKISEIIEAYE